MRKLLPYEHQLIEALGVTKDEYLNFVAIQQDYKDPKVGTELDIRNGDGGATVALVLTIVGTLFQVGAALLAPKPEIPDVGNRRQNRQQRFAPSFGFNSVQDLATYGDPVNLVYTNNAEEIGNPVGSVRVNGSLVWSAIENFGSTQFMQLMLVIGASKIKQINYNAIALGQKELANFDKGNFYIFGKADGAEGIPLFTDIRLGHQANTFFPSRLRPTAEEMPACVIAVHGNKKRGFSQAYTPTTATSLGVFDAIPINVNVLSRDEDGDSEESNILIQATEFYNGNNWINRTADFAVDEQIELRFSQANDIEDDTAPGKTAGDLRRQMIDALDFSSTYMLGSAKFRLQAFASNQNIETGDVQPIFKCIEAGACPSTNYGTNEPFDSQGGLKKEYINAIEVLSNTRKEGVTRDLSDEGNIKDSFVITNDSDPFVSIKYNQFKEDSDTELNEISWTPVLNLVDDDEDPIPDATYTLVADPVPATRAGSIEFSKELRQDLIDGAIIDVSQVKKNLRKQKKALKALIDDIHEGVFDGEDLVDGFPSYGPPWSAHSGRDPDENPTAGYVMESKVIDLQNDQFQSRNGGPEFIGYDKPFMNNDISVMVRYTFRYVDRHGTFNYFNFNGIEDTTKEKFFPKDPKLAGDDTDPNKPGKRKKLKDNKEDLANLQANRISIDNDAIAVKDYNADDNRIGGKEDTIEDIRESIQTRIDRNLGIMHKLAVVIIKDDIDYIETIMEQLPAKDQEDTVGKQTIKKHMKALIKQKQNDLESFEDIIGDWDEYRKSFDNTFFSKCLVKAEKASYETLSAIDTIKFSFKAKLFRRISGRQKKYGEEKVKKFSASDNGVKSRMAFFRMYYKKRGDTTKGLANIVFAVRRGSESDFYTQVTFKEPDSETNGRSKWVFEFEPVFDITSEHNSGRTFDESGEGFAFLEESNESPQIYTTIEGYKISWTGRLVEADKNIGYYPKETERGPIDTNEWDMFSVNSDTNVQFSHESGPEILLAAVTEQQIDASIANKYQNLTMMSLGVYANRGLQDLRNVSALVEKGKDSRIIDVTNETLSSSADSTSFAPDIFVDTLLDADNGVGKYVKKAHIDVDSLVIAKRFCINNGLPRGDGGAGDVKMFMDGIIADAGSWREFWINAAPFSLLELARKNGKDTLVPAVPCDNDGVAADATGLPTTVAIQALFTTGNILEGSYKEEFLNYGASTQDLIASIVYREFIPNELFSQNKTVNIQRSDASTDAVRETFDVSQFVSQREQAIMFGKLLCNQRHWVKKGIEFRTLPSEAGLEPGAFIYVDVGLKNWDHYSSGMVMAGGALNAPLASVNEEGVQDVDSNVLFNFLLYQPSTDTVTNQTASVTTTADGRSTASSLSEFEGYMFVMGKDKPDRRVFRVTELAIEEEGELSVKAIEYPCFEENDAAGVAGTRAHIADFRSSKFEVS